MKKANNDLFFIGLISLIWLVTYVLCTVLWEQKLGWDEVNYLATARGIVENFDFSSRYNTILGLIQYSFPQNTHHYPVYSFYLALFFKLFGVSLEVAYFSTWICALVISIFVYLTMLMLTEDDKLFSFLTAITFLFLPNILHYCDTAMMEIPGCALVSIFTFFIFRDVYKGRLNSFLLGLAAIWLYLYKSLYIGVIFGFIGLIIMSNNFKLTGLKIKNKFPLPVNLAMFLFIVSIINFIFAKFVFLPLAPMMNLDIRAVDSGVYADFLGGFFKDPLNNVLINTVGFFKEVVFKYFPHFPILLPPDFMEGYVVITRTWMDFGLFLIVIFYISVFLFFFWKTLSPINRTFIIFALVSILFLNIIFNLIVISNIDQRSRHNLLYLPLVLISSSLLLRQTNLLKDFRSIFVILSLIVLIYIPFYITEIRIEDWGKDSYHNLAHKHSNIVKKFIGDSKPMFVYFKHGTHTTWDSFPTRVILQDATNEQIKKINSRLPQPIEYLFLQPSDKLAAENKELILQELPIIDGLYTYYGADVENHFYIYKLNR